VKVLLLKSLIWLLSLMPMNLARSLGSGIGRLVYRLNTRMTQVARLNIDLCLPERSAAEREELVRQCLRETGRTLAETGITWNWSLQRSSGLLQVVHNEVLFDQALSAGRGVVIVLLHHGNWEMINAYLYTREVPFAAIYKPPKDPAIDRWITHSREKSGLSLYPTGREGAQSLSQRLREGGVVLYAPDQEPGIRSGVFAPFFGVDALTGTFTHHLLQENSQAIPLCTCVMRTAKGFVVRFETMDPAIYDADPVVSAAALNRSIEPVIRDQTEQYQWGYKRFKKRPPGQKKIYE